MKKYFYAITFICFTISIFSQANLLKGELLFLPLSENSGQISLQKMNANIIEKLERRGAVLKEEQKQKINILNQKKKQHFLASQQNALSRLPQLPNWSPVALKKYCPDYSSEVNKAYQACRREQMTNLPSTDSALQNCIQQKLEETSSSKACILPLFNTYQEAFQPYQDWINTTYMPQLRNIIGDDEIVRRAFPRYSLK